MSIAEAFIRIEPQLRKIIREEVRAALEETDFSPQNEVEVWSEQALLTSKQVGEYLHVSPVTIYRLRQNSELGFYRVGNRILFSMMEHVQPYLRSTGKPSRARRREYRGSISLLTEGL